jgi:hypothetical protein
MSESPIALLLAYFPSRTHALTLVPRGITQRALADAMVVSGVQDQLLCE